MRDFEIPVQLKQLITPRQAYHYRIVPVAKNGDTVSLITDNESLDQLVQELGIMLNFSTEISTRPKAEIQSYLSYNYRQQNSEVSQVSKSRFLEQLIQTAKEFRSSDIHIEPYERFSRVRFRLDGKLKEQYQIPLEEYPALINQIKVKAGLDIAEKRLSQDGRISFKDSSGAFDLRVSIMPALRGEKVVLRLLKQDAEAVELTRLGFNEHELQLYTEGIKKPNGMVLISGPTGSGKTTTLYGTLKLLNTEERNIVTVEDPIEYTLDGINQMQLREDIGYDFPTALRTFLRQDPDIIMVGEIRDEKTANMAMKAALTGHLVLSTIHTNSAWTTISRLIDMGIPSYLLASTLNMSVAQRLVRKLCSHCKEEKPTEATLFPPGFEGWKAVTTHYVAVGCDACYHTGYSGRKAVYEIIPISAKLAGAIKKNQLQIDSDQKDIKWRSLQENALDLVRMGETSIDEVYGILAT